MICPECGESFASPLRYRRALRWKKSRRNVNLNHSSLKCFVANTNEAIEGLKNLGKALKKRKWNSFEGYEPEWKAAGFENEEEWLLFIKENA